MQKRKTFTPEFTREAVRLLEQGDRTSADLARELNNWGQNRLLETLGAAVGARI